MQAILHGDGKGTSSRGDRVPKSVAGKYAAASKKGGSKDLPNSKGKEMEGGKWGEAHHAKDKKKVQQKRKDRKEAKKNLKKALEEYLEKQNHRGGGCLVIDSDGRMLLGKRTDTGEWTTPGGKIEDGESFQEGALRELKEESGISAKDASEIYSSSHGGWKSKTFKVTKYSGKLKSNGELSDLKFFDPHEIPWKFLTHYACEAICDHIKGKLKKSKDIKHLIAYEQLQKNITRTGGSTPPNTVYEVTHGDALKLVGNGTFRFLKKLTEEMQDEDLKDVKFDSYTIHIRKHVNDVYSGRILDGHKLIHQFTQKSLPAVAAELMSVFEWYLPEDEEQLELLDENDLSNDAIEGGLNELVDKYKKHNLSNIYSEMENIREEMRHGVAVDLQQVEQRMMSLFDKLENVVTDVADKHNTLGRDAGSAIDELENKLVTLQTKIEEMGKKPVTVEAFSPTPKDDSKVHSDFYPYLSKPKVVIDPSGKITISFDSDWASMERENFLKDMKAKIIKKS